MAKYEVLCDRTIRIGTDQPVLTRICWGNGTTRWPQWRLDPAYQDHLEVAALGAIDCQDCTDQRVSIEWKGIHRAIRLQIYLRGGPGQNVRFSAELTPVAADDNGRELPWGTAGARILPGARLTGIIALNDSGSALVVMWLVYSPDEAGWEEPAVLLAGSCHEHQGDAQPGDNDDLLQRRVQRRTAQQRDRDRLEELKRVQHLRDRQRRENDPGERARAKTKSVVEQLHHAITSMDAAGVRSALTEVTDVNALLDGGETALHVAVRCQVYAFLATPGQEEIVQALLTAGADLDARNAAQETSLHVALDGWHMHGTADLALIELLLEAGADPDAQDQRGRRPDEPVKGRYRHVGPGQINEFSARVNTLRPRIGALFREARGRVG